jgi:hypothetical protein
VIVNGIPEILGVLETALEAGHYDVVSSNPAHAYSQIKRVQPDLVILCVRIDPWTFRYLSMLKLDERRVHRFSHTTEYDSETVDGRTHTTSLARNSAPRPIERMN